MKLTLLCLACALMFSVASFDNDEDIPVESFSELEKEVGHLKKEVQPLDSGDSSSLLQKTRRAHHAVKKARHAKYVPVKVALHKGPTDKTPKPANLASAGWGFRSKRRFNPRRCSKTRRSYWRRIRRRRRRRYRRRRSRLCAKLYQHANYRGRVFKVYGNIRFLRGFNDQTSSIRVYRGCRVALYQHAKYGGRRYFYRGGRSYNFGTIRRTIGNDRVSSVRVWKSRGRTRRRRRKFYLRWRWVGRVKRMRGKLYRRRALYKCRGGRCRRTRRSYWRRISKRTRRRRRFSRHRRYLWRWGRRVRRRGKRLYRLRVLWKRVGRKWLRTKRRYWRRIRRWRGRRHMWRWGRRTKKVRGRLYRRRILFKRVGGKWRRTRRAYW